MADSKKNIDILKKSLIYQMSLGSRELYHSNIWAWLMEQDPIFIKVFFPNFPIDIKEYEIKREWKHIDISITYDSGGHKVCYFIENKIKSLPYKEQFERYVGEALKDYNEIHILYTGITRGLTTEDEKTIEGKSNDVKTFRFMNYGEVGKEIRGHQDKLDEKSRPEIEEYCDTIIAMQELLDAELVQYRNQLDYTDNLLSSVNLLDVYKKVKASDFLHYVLSKKDQLLEPPRGFKLYTHVSFNNGKSTIDVRWAHIDGRCDKKGREWDSELYVGIQIEEYSYRFVVGCPKEKIEPDILFHEIANIELGSGDYWFDKNYKKGQKLFGRYQTSLSPKDKEGNHPYNSYGGDSIFIYQFYDLNDGESRKYDNLFKAIKDDLNRAGATIEKLCKSGLIMFDD